MKIEIDLNERQIANGLELILTKYLSTKRGKDLLERKVNEKIDKVLSKEKITALAKSRMSRVITEANMKKIVDEFSKEEYDAKLSSLLKMVIGNDKTFKTLVKNEVKSLIKIG